MGLRLSGSLTAWLRMPEKPQLPISVKQVCVCCVCWNTVGWVSYWVHFFDDGKLPDTVLTIGL